MSSLVQRFKSEENKVSACVRPVIHKRAQIKIFCLRSLRRGIQYLRTFGTQVVGKEMFYVWIAALHNG